VQTLERIRPLDPATIAQIAAGEVIERPVSVVKELVENSLDAGAGWIAVDLRGGGRWEIVVADDGRGIAAEDLPLAVQRHSTSKLVSASELFAIRTLGFRGEGLASIAAACATLEIVSRATGQDFGARIAVRDGTASSVSRAAAAPGTKVVVRDLFAPTPVRREFLGSERAEFSRISAFLSRLALGWPRVAFSLHRDGKAVWSLPAVDSPIERLEMVFGRGSRGSLTPVVTSPNIMIAIGGFTSRIGADRPNRNGQVIFVNGRLVRSPAVNAAWSSAYENKLITGRYPYGVLILSLPPGDVDVNVHPTKIEVRFVSAAVVFDAVRSAVSGALNPATVARTPHRAADLKVGSEGAPVISLLDGFTDPREAAGASEVRALGQIDYTYIVMSDRRELCIIDQHAAHERVAFETLAGQSSERCASAPLLVPEVVELTKDQVTTLESFREELAAMGIVVEPFGDDAYRICALPTGYAERHLDLRALLDDLSASVAPADIAADHVAADHVAADHVAADHVAADHVAADLQVGFAASRRRKILASIACHSVVRAHEQLSTQEQRTLYERLRNCREPLTCPHGRPTMLRFDASSLAKAFRRA
jgi:DNA mismatch repair protein MutL